MIDIFFLNKKFFLKKRGKKATTFTPVNCDSPVDDTRTVQYCVGVMEIVVIHKSQFTGLDWLACSGYTLRFSHLPAVRHCCIGY